LSVSSNDSTSTVDRKVGVLRDVRDKILGSELFYQGASICLHAFNFGRRVGNICPTIVATRVNVPCVSSQPAQDCPCDTEKTSETSDDD